MPAFTKSAAPAVKVGTVKFTKDNFGFIAPDDGGEQLFFHLGDTVDAADPVRGDRVEFTPTCGRDGRARAENVRII